MLPNGFSYCCVFSCKQGIFFTHDTLQLIKLTNHTSQQIKLVNGCSSRYVFHFLLR